MTKIDFHVHFFPDMIAERAIQKLSAAAGIPAYTNGGLVDTLKNLTLNGIDKAVLLPIATNERQMRGVNDFALSVNGGKIISFGSVFPLCDGAVDELKRIKSLGFKGIKLHPEYQNFEVSDERAFPIYDFCEKNDMIITFHAGRDYAFKDRCYSSPASIAKVAKTFPDLKMVAAHMGGFAMWNDVLKYLAGLHNVWFDTAFTALDITKEQFMAIYNRHNPEQILFATDLPWSEGTTESRFINSLGLSELQKAQIYHLNAAALLNDMDLLSLNG